MLYLHNSHLYGREVTALVNKHQKPGYYEVQFNESSAEGGLTSGVYFYLLKAGDYLEAKKMILLR